MLMVLLASFSMLSTTMMILMLTSQSTSLNAFAPLKCLFIQGTRPFSSKMKAPTPTPVKSLPALSSALAADI